MTSTFHTGGPFPSGTVAQSMVTVPDDATMRHQADLVGVPELVTDAAIAALRSGSAAAVVMSGQIASGKDTVAAHVARRLEASLGRPAVTHQTSAPMRVEYAEIIELVASAATLEAASDALEVSMGVPGPAAAHMAAQLFELTRSPLTCPDPDERTDLNRHMLQFHADHGRRALDPQYWTSAFFRSVYSSLADGCTVLLTGCRYPNEIAPAQNLGLMTVRLRVSRAVQETRLRGRDGLEPDPATLDNPNETALDDYVGFNLAVGNDTELGPTVDRVVEHVTAHVARLAR